MPHNALQLAVPMENPYCSCKLTLRSTIPCTTMPYILQSLWRIPAAAVSYNAAGPRFRPASSWTLPSRRCVGATETMAGRWPLPPLHSISAAAAPFLLQMQSM